MTMNSDLRDKLDTLRGMCQDDDFWSVVTALRGPDSPSETPSMDGEQHARAYAARRKRK